jgi:ABC-type amino acid transport substrate-binding protein
VFHCITREHAALVARLNRALLSMKSDGTLEQIIRAQTASPANN